MTMELPNLEIAVFARTLATSFAKGIPLIDALDTITESTHSIALPGCDYQD
jgi:type II secretory pathway component PulF